MDAVYSKQSSKKAQVPWINYVLMWDVVNISGALSNRQVLCEGVRLEQHHELAVEDKQSGPKADSGFSLLARLAGILGAGGFLECFLGGF